MLTDAVVKTQESDSSEPAPEEKPSMDPNDILQSHAKEQESTPATKEAEDEKVSLSASQFEVLDDFITEMNLGEQEVYDGSRIKGMLARTEELTSKYSEELQHPEPYEDDFLDFGKKKKIIPPEDPEISAEKTKILGLHTLNGILVANVDESYRRLEKLKEEGPVRKKAVKKEAPPKLSFKEKTLKKLRGIGQKLYHIFINPLVDRLHHLDEYFPELEEPMWKPKIFMRVTEEALGAMAIMILLISIFRLSLWFYEFFIIS